MIEVLRTPEYESWFASLRDRSARFRILNRVRRLSLGNPGDCRSVGAGVHELRIHSGPGYRVYYLQRGNVVIILLAGGDKSTQARDIRKARSIADKWR